MKKPSQNLALLLLAVAALCAWARPVAAETSLVTKGGTLFEAFVEAAPTTGAGGAFTDPSNPRTNVLSVRVTDSDGISTLEQVASQSDSVTLKPWAVEYEPTTQTLFVVYTQSSGLMSNVYVAMRREGTWSSRIILANPGLYLSLNPRAVVTRQAYVDVDSAKKPVSKVRSILSLVWWEENGSSQARYAAVFVEDAVLKLDEIQGYNLNELAGAAGPTSAGTLPVSAYAFPAMQRDPASNGGVVVSFANLANGTQTVLKISFPDDVTKLLIEKPADASATSVAIAQARAHVPVGREGGRGRIPVNVDTQGDVDAFVSPSGVTNFYWKDGDSLRYIGSDAAEGAKPNTLLLRQGLSIEKAINVIREMTARD